MDRDSMYGLLILNQFLSTVKRGVYTMTKTEFNRDFDEVRIVSVDSPAEYRISMLVGHPKEGGHHCELCEEDYFNCISEVEEADFNDQGEQ